jgi:hypothetical protein
MEDKATSSSTDQQILFSRKRQLAEPDEDEQGETPIWKLTDELLVYNFYFAFFYLINYYN